jgi:hypothetical protein
LKVAAISAVAAMARRPMRRCLRVRSRRGIVDILRAASNANKCKVQKQIEQQMQPALK